MSILKMLTYKRPAGSEAEKAFIKEFIEPYSPYKMCGNQVIVVPGDPETLFSCHTDTVHREGGKQEVIFDSTLNVAYKDDKEPLGADNTAGVWLLLQMIQSGVPGTYAFHYGEEKGCIGSGQMARDKPKWLKQFKRAIAFDRRGNTSVITHQMSTRCCSDIFGDELAKLLGMQYKRDPTGLYTDTAQYTHLIPECTNVSVGYQHEHGPDEMLDIEHLELLREVVVQLNWHTLPTVRVPIEADGSARNPAKKVYSSQYSGSFGKTSVYDKDEAITPSMLEEDEGLMDQAWEDICSQGQAVKLCKDDPELAGAMLYAFIWNRDRMYNEEFKDEIEIIDHDPGAKELRDEDAAEDAAAEALYRATIDREYAMRYKLDRGDFGFDTSKAYN